MRRSTRESAAAISFTAPCRSSIRPCRETAKSTRSDLPPPSSTSCAARTRRTLSHAYSAVATATTATPQAPIAIQAAAELEIATGPTLLRQGEHDRILRRVVRRARLAGHGLHVDLDRRRSSEFGLTEVLERDALRLAGVDQLDPFRLRDR